MRLKEDIMSFLYVKSKEVWQQSCGLNLSYTGKIENFLISHLYCGNYTLPSIPRLIHFR